ncbi:pheromone A receptor-domain-containing protein, partial [Flagelloscypha sp. PMI_526]
HAFQAFSFIGLIASLVSLPSHLNSSNIGLCAFLIWAGLISLIQFVNAIVWEQSVENVAAVWCDLSTKLLIGASAGIPAAALCAMRRVYYGFSSKSAVPSRGAKIGDYVICISLPVLAMVIHILVQPRRFDILEQVGCNLATLLFLEPLPLFLGLWTFGFSVSVIRRVFADRLEQSRLTSRTLRLAAFALLVTILTDAIAIFTIYFSFKQGIHPLSELEGQRNFSRVDQFTTWRDDKAWSAKIELIRWFYPLIAIVFFGMFSKTSDNQTLPSFMDKRRPALKKIRLTTIFDRNGPQSPRNTTVISSIASPTSSQPSKYNFHVSPASSHHGCASPSPTFIDLPPPSLSRASAISQTSHVTHPSAYSFTTIESAELYCGRIYVTEDGTEYTRPATPPPFQGHSIVYPETSTSIIEVARPSSPTRVGFHRSLSPATSVSVLAPGDKSGAKGMITVEVRREEL